MLKGGLRGPRRFLERCQLFTLAESLGGVESLIEHPAIMTHASMPGDAGRLGIDDRPGAPVGRRRSDVDDLIQDLRSALA